MQCAFVFKAKSYDSCPIKGAVHHKKENTYLFSYLFSVDSFAVSCLFVGTTFLLI